MTRTVPFRLGLNDVIKAPVEALKAAMRFRATSPLPAGEPGGRTDVNSPPTYTTPFAAAIPRTVPLVCQAGEVLPGRVPWRA